MELEGLVGVKMSDTPFLEQPLLFTRLPFIKGCVMGGGWGGWVPTISSVSCFPTL